MATLPVGTSPPLPFPSGRQLGDLAAFDQDLVRALYGYLSGLAQRANSGLPIDGSLPMTGNLDLGGNDIINVGALTINGLGNGLVVHTGSGAYVARTLTGTANKITVTNGSGVAGAPTLTIPDAVTLVTPTVTGLLTVSGGQIAFPATQIPSTDVNTLDDYEEGTYTPELQFGGGTTGITYSVRKGEYIKIGKLVMFVADFTLTSKGSSVGTAGITLPFSAVGLQKACPVSFMSNMVGVTNTPVGATAGSIAALRFFTTTSVTVMNDTHFSNTSRFIITGVYEATS